MLKKIVGGPLAQGERGVRVVPGGQRQQRRHRESTATNRAGGPLMTWHNLRQQNVKPTGNPNLCLADFIAPKATGVKDYIGAFAVTAGIGIEKRLDQFEKQHDDYSSIMLKALADRLREAFTELLHKARAPGSSGIRQGGGPRQCGTDRGEIPRHPARARLPGVPGPHREGRAVRFASMPSARASS